MSSVSFHEILSWPTNIRWMKFAGELSVFAATQRYLLFSYFITEIISHVSKGSPYITPSGVRVNDQALFTLHIRSRSAQDKLTVKDLFGIVTMKGLQHWVSHFALSNGRKLTNRCSAIIALILSRIFFQWSNAVISIPICVKVTAGVNKYTDAWKWYFSWLWTQREHMYSVNNVSVLLMPRSRDWGTFLTFEILKIKNITNKKRVLLRAWM